ncbi:hypothetical protein BV898_19792 [Hypsibius exemplaris]|uniref:Uncharacterized protein n=1 Tax=Hypsibius exemplaris TaxID=2072580 RepID=A0A9X6NRM7_HYPEX|nr:hypothetical protein BV898_19792 [Hypsibius exemplaris]
MRRDGPSALENYAAEYFNQAGRTAQRSGPRSDGRAPSLRQSSEFSTPAQSAAQLGSRPSKPLDARITGMKDGGRTIFDQKCSREGGASWRRREKDLEKKVRHWDSRFMRPQRTAVAEQRTREYAAAKEGVGAERFPILLRHPAGNELLRSNCQ